MGVFGSSFEVSFAVWQGGRGNTMVVVRRGGLYKWVGACVERQRQKRETTRGLLFKLSGSFFFQRYLVPIQIILECRLQVDTFTSIISTQFPHPSN